MRALEEIKNRVAWTRMRLEVHAIFYGWAHIVTADGKLT